MFERACAGSAPELGGGEALRACARAFREFARLHGGLFDLMSTVRLSPADPDFAGIGGALLSRIAAPLRSLGVADADVTHAARGFRSAVHGFVVLERQQQFAMNSSVEESFEWMLDLLVGGLGAGTMSLPG